MWLDIADAFQGKGRMKSQFSFCVFGVCFKTVVYVELKMIYIKPKPISLNWFVCALINTNKNNQTRKKKP